MTTTNNNKAYFAGGCFWCIEGPFNMIQGVTSAISGYTGGHTPNPTYEQICTGTSGHAETVEITYNPEEITYEDLLNIFFSLHDPTSLNRQGNDTGTQYRSAIFYQTEEEKEIIQKKIQELNNSGYYSSPIVTEVTKLEEFYPAEAHHQDYYASNPHHPYCTIMIDPKIKKLKDKWKKFLKKN